MPSPDPGTWLARPRGHWRGPVPVADIDSTPFWDGLRRHEMRILRCAECRTYVHPPQASCPRCLSLTLTPEAVSGRGTVYSFTVVNREFAPGIEPPYVAALVDLDEQDGLRLVTNIVDARLGDVQIGMPVRAVFVDLELEAQEDATLVFFEPHPGTTGGAEAPQGAPVTTGRGQEGATGGAEAPQGAPVTTGRGQEGEAGTW